VVPLHADAVAQNRSAGGAAAGVDGDDRDGLAEAPQLRSERIDERAFPCAGRAGDADGEACAFGQFSHALKTFGYAVFDERGQLCEFAGGHLAG